ncbi:MAG TPA: tRNA glutamyl-Q(34) synthetase GluQRS [Pseudomonas sabulinigri]|uniref:Glutamyl/glutaminyl-tRNA synthetase class Ib catalytic domain-containing protein n=1 Tax=marine sediment metagenome TaxID=412755 RepID=A0A0F9TRA0_9ZZZZ|nr:tRNA glutamyl-Q(34) synthetase GluQRS [Halopseudomonas sabulinigri]HEC51402.1 tRNA glutamyl-Q(34) synthetase GluQRS [Halopseudomonas sabulinigri]
MHSATPYIGRFAPTPSGYLHFGSLLAALASYLDARHQQGRWLIRVEDLDQPRSIPGASEHIIETLACYGMYSDGEIIFQQDRLTTYQAQIDQWLTTGQAYYCDCSRRQLAEFNGIYPGTCRHRQLPAAADHAVRLIAPKQPLTALDRLQPPLTQDLATATGDFIIRRRDGIYAYQLAVVLDDIAQGVTDVVRGADLLDSTPRQQWIYQLLGQPLPRYLHIPLLLRADGEKLSKRLGSTPLDPAQAPTELFRALQALTQQPPLALRNANIAEQLEWAIAHWRPQQLSPTQNLQQDSLFD